MRCLTAFACFSLCGLLGASAARLSPSDITAASVRAAERVAEAAATAGLVPAAGLPIATERRRTLKDAISSEVNAIAAASCAMAGPVQCRETQEFVSRMQAFCSEQYGYTR